MNKILRVKEIAKELNVSKSTACRLVKQVLSHYDLDPNRMPVEGACPEWAFLEYYQLDRKEKKHGSKI